MSPFNAPAVFATATERLGDRLQREFGLTYPQRIAVEFGVLALASCVAGEVFHRHVGFTGLALALLRAHLQTR